MSGAGCSRVTHPFAARVPRRAFPLDLHVLSTPPAFVLSQDQTLQKMLFRKQTLTNTHHMDAVKGIHHTHKSGCDGVVHHALAFNTLLSSQETDATTEIPDQIRLETSGRFPFNPVSRATPLTYPIWPPGANPEFRTDQKEEHRHDHPATPT